MGSWLIPGGAGAVWFIIHAMFCAGNNQHLPQQPGKSPTPCLAPTGGGSGAAGQLRRQRPDLCGLGREVLAGASPAALGQGGS